MRTLTIIRASALPLLFAAALPLTADAQQASDRADRADALFERAAHLEQDPAVTAFPRHVREIADLYLKSASLRDVSDPVKVESLHRAGTLLYPINPRKSRRVLGKAAELALKHGDVALSAGAYLDAAAVVQTKRLRSSADRRAANEYRAMARTLADHSVLSAEQRSSILQRIDMEAVALQTR